MEFAKLHSGASSSDRMSWFAELAEYPSIFFPRVWSITYWCFRPGLSQCPLVSSINIDCLSPVLVHYSFKPKGIKTNTGNFLFACFCPQSTGVWKDVEEQADASIFTSIPCLKTAASYRAIRIQLLVFYCLSDGHKTHKRESSKPWPFSPRRHLWWMCNLLN